MRWVSPGAMAKSPPCCGAQQKNGSCGWSRIGPGARKCLDELLEDRPAPNRLARDHRGVAEAIRSGWADAGVCLELAAAEANLNFVAVRREAYDLCYAASNESDPRIRALIAALQSKAFRTLLGDLPGYHANSTGTLASTS